MIESFGTVEDGVHVLAVRVYYQDTDAGGVVYHANYLNFAERGRNEMIRAVGFDMTRLRNEFGMIFVIRDCRMDFRRPARLDDLLEVRTRPLQMGGASFRVEQRILREGEDLTTLDMRIGCVSPEGRPVRMPVPFRESFEHVFTMNQG